MNKTKIPWCDYSWNPYSGCTHGCPYCYARRISMRFKGHFNPEFHPERLDEPMKLKEPSRIFLGSMSDTFGEFIESDWLSKTFATIEKCPQHTFITLTKRPENIRKYADKIPKNLWVGVSVDRQANEKRVMELWESGFKGLKFVSFEPLLEEIYTNLSGMGWVIIGGQTNPTKIPNKEWVDKIVAQAQRMDIPIFIKGNCKYEDKIQEYPRG